MQKSLHHQVSWRRICHKFRERQSSHETKTQIIDPSLSRFYGKTQHSINLPYLAVALSLLFSTLLSIFPTVEPVHAASWGCDDVQFIYARGSGETDQGNSYQVWERELEFRMHNARLKYSYYDLGSERDNDVEAKYQAVPVTGSFDGIINLIGAAISGGEAFAFSESVDSGVEELKQHVEKVGQTCPDTKFVLGGFSQGAMVISKSLDQLDPEKIIYAATFGDPKLYLPEGKPNGIIINRAPDACKGINLSNYRVYVPDCYAYEGALGSYRPYQPEGYKNKLGTWCNNKDIMCSSGMSVSDHIDYVNGDFYTDAAKVIKYRIDEHFYRIDHYPTIDPSVADKGDANIHDVAFLFDLTGSMKEMLDTYKAEAKRLLQKVMSAGGRVALYGYKEYGGDWPALGCDFGCTEEQVSKEIDRLRASGGADDDEGLLSAIKTAFDNLNWMQGATKSIVVLTDAGFHNPDKDGSSLIDIVLQSLAIDPVNIYVISKGQEETYRELVSLTNGKYYDIADENTLTDSTSDIFNRPVAKLNQASFYGTVGDTITFDASKSYGFAEGDNLSFDWDLDGTNAFNETSHKPAVTKTFTEEFDGYIQVRVSDSLGSSTMSAYVKISPLPEQPTTINNLKTEKGTDTSINVTFSTDAKQVLVVLEDLPVGFAVPEEGKINFTVADLEKTTKLTLIPYSGNERRGTSAFTTLNVGNTQIPPTESETTGKPTTDPTEKPSKPTTDSKDKDIIKPSTPEDSHRPSPDNNSSSTIIAGTNSSAVKPIIIAPGLPKKEDSITFIPKVPNTGCR